MPMADVVSLVEDHLDENWTYCPVRGFADDSGSTPADGTAYLEVQYPFSRSDQISVGAPGNNMFREEGGIRFLLNMPRDATGRAAALTQADTLASLFRARQFGASGSLVGMQTWSPSSPVIDDATDDGNYLVLAIVVPYQANFLA